MSSKAELDLQCQRFLNGYQLCQKPDLRAQLAGLGLMRSARRALSDSESSRVLETFNTHVLMKFLMHYRDTYRDVQNATRTWHEVQHNIAPSKITVYRACIEKGPYIWP